MSMLLLFRGTSAPPPTQVMRVLLSGTWTQKPEMVMVSGSFVEKPISVL